MKVQMFESKSPFKGQQIKLGLAAVLGSAAFLLGGCSQNLGINSGTDQTQAEEESAVVDYTCISNPDSEKKITVYFISGRLSGHDCGRVLPSQQNRPEV